jgi:ABC-type uncharacterized transport system involved in gliding motility auxiliary subunit
VNNKLLSGAGLIMALVLLLAINMLSSVSFTSARLDLTERQAYTLSDGTINILNALDEPVTVRLFLSERLATETPSVSTYANRVRDMLHEFQRRAGGNIILRIIDPEPFSEDEDRAVGYGLHGIPLDAEGTKFYFGLVGSNATDDEVVVPYLSLEREEFLEYDLAKVLWQLSDIDTKVMGLMSTLPVNGIDPQRAMMMGPQAPPSWVVMDQITQLFEVRPVETTATHIPHDIDVLMLVHPKNFSEQTLYAIDQFVMRGGRLALFYDPYSETERAPPGPPRPGMSRSSSLGNLLDAWGIQIDTSKFVGDISHAVRVRFEFQGQMITVDYPAWIDLTSERMAEKDTVTSELGKLMFATPGHIASSGKEGVSITPLVSSSDQAMLIDVTTQRPGQDPRTLVRDYKPGGEPFTLAARINGRLTSAYPDGAPKPAAGSEAAASGGSSEHPHLAASKDEVNMVVVADADFMADRFWVQVQNLLGTRLAVPTNGNGSLVVNSLDSLTGSNDLISVRSRGRHTRPFKRVDDIRRKAELQFREKEQQLTEQLRQTEAKLVELSQGGKPGGDALVLSEAQQTEVERFTQEKLRIRKDLRDVLHQRRKDINELEFTLRMLNIGFMPLLVIIAGVLMALWQAQRRRRAEPQAAS